VGLAPLCEDAVRLSIDWRCCVIELPARAHKIAAAAARADLLATIASKLSGQMGPYR
jgi:hypothetical protein